MEKTFQKILALVDHSEASIHAAEEAALLASRFESELHLLHIDHAENSNSLILQVGFFFDTADKEEENYYNRFSQLEKIKNNLIKRYNVTITCFEERGKFVEVVRDHVKDFSIDLIVLGAYKRNWIKEFFKQSKARSLIKFAECEVLCVRCEFPATTFKKIVLPVGKFVSKKKIAIAYQLAKKFASNIHFIALNKPEKQLDQNSSTSLIASYRYLRDITNMPIECNTIAGSSLAEATMRYAKVIEADLILIDEDAESDLRKSLFKGDMVTHSQVPVLSVQTLGNRSKTRYRA